MASLESRFSRYKSRIPKTGKRNAARLQHYMQEANAAGNTEIANDVAEMAWFGIFTFGNHYHLDSPEVQVPASERLLRTFRDNPNFSTANISEKFLALRNVGPHMALTILNNIAREGFEWGDLSQERRDRYTQKSGANNAISNRDTFGFSPTFTALADREVYMELSKHITPRGIAGMIGIPYEEFEQQSAPGRKYYEIWKAAQDLLPPIGNPFDHQYGRYMH